MNFYYNYFSQIGRVCKKNCHVTLSRLHMSKLLRTFVVRLRRPVHSVFTSTFLLTGYCVVHTVSTGWLWQEMTEE